uniref:Uncharacterized protein n=1 Tax=Cannabis sativa TaxID=3483 RepID=A0A803QQK4_CANSA
MTEFLVVDLPSSYHVILGRPTLYTLGTITSIKNLALKFPTTTGNKIVKGDQLAARECYNVTMRGRPQPGAHILVVSKVNEVGNMGAREVPEVEEIDPRVGDDWADLDPIEELEDVFLSPNDPTKTIKVGKHLNKDFKKVLI